MAANARQKMGKESLMRITPVILVIIGIIIILYPEQMLREGAEARWVGGVLIALGVFLFWNMWRKIKRNKS